MNKIGFEWYTYRDDWEAMYQRLVEFKKKNETTCVPHGYKEDPKLVRWVKRQRTNCKLEYRVDLLNKIGFVWDARF